jgi:hypothetical protein
MTIEGQGGEQQTAAITGAKFEVRQPENAPVTELVLRGSDLKDCPRLSHGQRSHLIDEGAIAARSRGRALFGSGHGRFRTRGRWASATVRGTVWKVADTCDGTQTNVLRGVVKVHDFGLDRIVSVRAGQQYLAKARP